tara:strand:+ start:224 stop:397 length:174 start_codon:yes stop_codon:yes gene_type:complete
MAKEFTCLVELSFSGNNYEADSVKEYKQKVKDNFLQEFDITLIDDEISCIEEKKEIL